MVGAEDTEGTPGGARWTRAQALTYAPDARSVAAAEALARPQRWEQLGSDGRLLWGFCPGSGKNPYQTAVDVPRAAFTCSCPSRKIWCKHGVALALLWTLGHVPDIGVPPTFAAEWAARHDARADRPAKPATTTVADPDAAALRLAQRRERVDSGLLELDQWLGDQLRAGLAGLPRAGYAHFDAIAARLVDAQAGGVANILRGIPSLLVGQSWPERLLDQLASLQLLIAAHRRLDELPSDLAATVRSRVGYPVARDDVLSRAGIRDTWIALGEVESLEGRLESRRVWLLGQQTGSWAMLLGFAPPGGALDRSVRPSRRLVADLHFYPGSGQYRALIGNEPATAEHDVELAAGAGIQASDLPVETLSQAQGRFARLLGADPWATRMPALIRAIPTPESAAPGARGSVGNGDWWLTDEQGFGVRLVDVPYDPWRLVALAADGPVTAFVEWGVQGCRGLSLIDGAELVPLDPDGWTDSAPPPRWVA